MESSPDTVVRDAPAMPLIGDPLLLVGKGSETAGGLGQDISRDEGRSQRLPVAHGEIRNNKHQILCRW